MTTNGNPLLDELVTFTQNRLPGFDAGEYQLTVTQTVDDAAGKPISGETIASVTTFAVLGDRFTFAKPATTLYATFPAANATGEFSTVLPHVVLTNPTLPWSRYPTTHEPSGEGDADVPTWLAVLLLDEDDVAACPGLRLPPANATVGDLFPQGAVSTSTLGANDHSYFDGAKDTSGLEPGQTISDPISVLDVPLALFRRLAPTIADLALLAHVRDAEFTAKTTVPGVSDVGEPTGTFSLVFGNRLPQTNKKTYAYLVSLEEMERLLPADEHGAPPPNAPEQSDGNVRLAVLASWTFFSTGEPATFVDRLLSLNRRDPSGSADATNTNLRLNYTGTNEVVGHALDMGYVPLDHLLRTAGRTVSWYRGPLVPYPIATPALTFPISSPDAALVFDPTTGMFDGSYAAAWTLGRMLALQDVKFSTALYNWKKGLTNAVLDAIERELLAIAFGELAGTAFALAAGAAAPPRAVHRLIGSLLASLEPES